MKKMNFFILAVLCLYASSLTAQLSSFELSVADATSQLSTTEITTGIFYEKMPAYVPYKNNTGKYLADSLITDASEFQTIYSGLHYSHVGVSSMLHPDSLWADFESKAAIPAVYLSGIYYRYNRFKPDALANNLVTWDGTHFQDVAGRTESPYREDSVFVFSALREEFNGDSVPFHLKSTDIFSNITTMQNLQIDFGDGNGFIPLQTDSTYWVYYETDSLKTIQVKYIDGNGDILISETTLFIKPSLVQRYSNAPDDSFIIGSSTTRPIFGLDPNCTSPNPFDCIIQIGEETIPTSGVEVSYWLNNERCEGSPCIRKPLIIVEGYDEGGNIDDTEVINIDGDGLLQIDYDLPGGDLDDLIEDEGYDIFYINYAVGGDPIESNAAWVVQAIDEINRLKHECGSNEKNIVVGASMGGLVGKWALSDMENNGPDHETELYISFDSPLKGANIPIGVQLMIQDLNDLEVFGKKLGDREPAIRRGLRVLTAPAAQQMLIYSSTLYPENLNTFDANGLKSTHDAFQSIFDTKTIEVPHLVIANGSWVGDDQGIGDNTVMLDQFLGDNYVVASALIRVVVRTTSDNSSSRQVYHRTLEETVFNVPVRSPTSKSLTNMQNFDNAPGGTRGTEDFGDDLDFDIETYCFIPTVSALGMDLSNLNPPNLNDVAATLATGGVGVRSYIGAEVANNSPHSSTNQDHVSLDANSAPFLLSLINEGQGLKNVLEDRTYNFGQNFSLAHGVNLDLFKTPSIIDHNLDVVSNGRLWVNRGDRIGYTDITTNVTNETPKDYPLYIQPDICNASPVTLNILSGGKFIIGDRSISNTGQVHVMPTSTIKVGDAGEVILEQEYDNFISLEGGVDEDGVVANATMLIEEGGLVRAEWGSRIVVEDKGILHIKTGGTLSVSQYSDLEVKEGGTLIIEAGANIDLKDIESNIHIQAGGSLILNGIFNFSGSGFFQFDADHILTMNDVFKLEGAGKGNRMVQLNDGCVLDITSFGLDWSLGKVVYQANSKIRLNANTEGFFWGVEFPGGEGAIAVQALGANAVYCNDCDFTDWSLALEASDLNGAAPLPTSPNGSNRYFTVKNSLFDGCWSGIEMSNFKKFDISDTEFLGANGVVAVYAETINNGYFTDVDASNYVGGIPAINLYDVDNTRVKSSNFRDNGTAFYLGTTGGSGCNIDFDCSILETNGIGVEMESMPARGLLSMRYSSLICNGIGVKGFDIEINVNHGKNRFEYCGGGYLEGGGVSDPIFEICWQTKPRPTVLYMSQNLWVDHNGNNPSPSGPRPYMFRFSENADCESVDHWTVSMMVQGLAPLMSQPACPVIGLEPVFPEIEDEEEECSGDEGSVGFELSDNLLNAEIAFASESSELSDNRGESHDLHFEIADIPSDVSEVFPELCKTFIKIAQARIGYEGNTSGKLFSNTPSVKDVTYTKDDLGYPNPVSDIYTIPLAEGLHQIQLFDLYGKLLFETKAEEKGEIDMSTLQEGVYLIRVENTRTGDMKSGKVLKQ